MPDAVTARADEAADQATLFTHEIRRYLAEIVSTRVVGAREHQRNLARGGEEGRVVRRVVDLGKVVAARQGNR